MAVWLKQCGIGSWPCNQRVCTGLQCTTFEQAELEVELVNAREMKKLPGAQK